jgi:DNA-binding NarL/FixJ family response regulator
MAQSTHRVLIVDDHPLVREGLKGLIAQEADLRVCAEAGGVGSALEMARERRPDVAIVDLSLEDGNGLDLIRRLNSHFPSIRILVCSMRDEALFARRAIDAGAHGYINKHEVAGHVIAALRQVLAGKTYLGPDIADRGLGGATPEQPLDTSAIGQLSNRELEVYGLIGRGCSTAEIARQLSLSVKTIETHRQHIKRKLGLTCAGELVRHAVHWDLEQG